MKLTSAVKKLETAGWEIQSNLGTYIAAKNGATIQFFVNPGSDTCSRFTYDSHTQCAPTYGMSLKGAMA